RGFYLYGAAAGDEAESSSSGKPRDVNGEAATLRPGGRGGAPAATAGAIEARPVLPMIHEAAPCLQAGPGRRPAPGRPPPAPRARAPAVPRRAPAARRHARAAHGDPESRAPRHALRHALPADAPAPRSRARRPRLLHRVASGWPKRAAPS